MSLALRTIRAHLEAQLPGGSLAAEPGAVPAVPFTPEHVLAAVDDRTLVATLMNGRPRANERRLLDIQGVAAELLVLSGRSGVDSGLPPVVCVHGLGHDAWDFAPAAELLASATRVSTIDLPGFGFSDKPAHCTLDLMADALLAAADEARAATGRLPVIVASSMGGHVALIAALRAPRAFAGLFLAAPGGFTDASPALQGTLRAYYAVDAICARPEAEILANSRRIFVRPHPKGEALAARKLSIHRSAFAREFAAPFSAVVYDVLKRPMTQSLAAVMVPAMVLSGSQDVVVPPSICKEGARALGAPFVVFENIGHCAHLEATERFVDTVLGFCGSVDSTATGTNRQEPIVQPHNRAQASVNKPLAVGRGGL